MATLVEGLKLGHTAVQAKLTHSSPWLGSGSGCHTNMEIAEGNFRVNHIAVLAIAKTFLSDKQNFSSDSSQPN